MTVPTSPAQGASRLSRLKGFLQQDPANLALLADAASAAIDENLPEEASALLGRYSEISPLTPPLQNLMGVAAIGLQDFEGAAGVFSALLAAGSNSPALRFNLAWSRAMLDDHEGTLELLDDEVVDASPRAASLKVQMLHHLARLDEALVWGEGVAQQYPDDEALMGALAVTAMDEGREDLARAYSAGARNSPDGLSVSGLLALGDGAVEQSDAFFDRALASDPANPRALIGKGLGRLTAGDSETGVRLLEEGAAIFGDHLGSWIAVAWAHFARGDHAASRLTFEKALALDDTFAESHGGLAVLDILAGEIESARRRSDVALRLDRHCLSAALAQSLLAEADGAGERAERIRAIAMSQPLTPGGPTLAQAMAKFAATGRP